MKTCPVCGLVVDESYLFCPEDGSALAQPEALPQEAEIDRPAKEEKAKEEKAAPVVLYCPACAAEYPLTFSSCPVHAIPLTKHRIPTFVAPVTKPSANETAKVVPPSKTEEEISFAEVKSQDAAPVIENQLPSLADVEFVQPKVAQSGRRFRFNHAAGASPYTSMGLGNPVSTRETEAEQIENISDAYESGDEREPAQGHQSFRTAAYVITACLLLLAILGLASLYKNISRRPAPAATTTAARSSLPAQQPVTVYTPQEALDYKEEKIEPDPKEIANSTDDSASEKVATHSAIAANSRSQTNAQSRQPEYIEQRPLAALRQQPGAQTPSPISASRPSQASELVLPRGTFGQIDARIVNIRSRKTADGVRYDMTFRMQEEAGRTTQWERLAISTRSASGISRSQIMPFYHRLGATGTLTFTVSVEMPGRSQPDFQGKIICTSIGTDQSGKAYRASFGANVSPN